MSEVMTDLKATATAHMRSDLETGGKWVCACEACGQVRALVGMEKVLGVRPLVRAIEQAEAELADLPPGPERQRVWSEYLRLHDDLAAAVAG